MIVRSMCYLDRKRAGSVAPSRRMTLFFTEVHFMLLANIKWIFLENLYKNWILVKKSCVFRGIDFNNIFIKRILIDPIINVQLLTFPSTWYWNDCIFWRYQPGELEGLSWCSSRFAKKNLVCWIERNAQIEKSVFYHRRA